jgi:hypothetical protein
MLSAGDIETHHDLNIVPNHEPSFRDQPYFLSVQQLFE